jgi:predicted nucleic acid-binding protein
MVAALCAWHEHHERAVREIELRLGNGEALVVAAPALIETYAVLTRIPPPHRLSPTSSKMLLEANFMGDGVETVALDADAYRRLLERAPERDIAGGRIYDAIIVACGLAAGVDVLLTFNDRQFRSLVPQGVQIVVPL